MKDKKPSVRRLYAALDALIDYEGEIKASTCVNSHSYSAVCDALRGLIDELESEPLSRKGEVRNAG